MRKNRRKRRRRITHELRSARPEEGAWRGTRTLDRLSPISRMASLNSG
jgi:hypothetical protein